jgi:hypothetical protein
MKTRDEKYYQTTSCLFCGKEIYDLIVKNRKYCCVSHQSKHKFILNPVLKNVSSKNGKKAMKTINNDGRAFRMKKGFWDDEHKKKISRIMKNKKVSNATKEKIKKHHWSRNEKKRKVIIENQSKLIAEKILNGDYNKQNKNFKTGYYFSIKSKMYEYYSSSYELSRMKELDFDDSVRTWTKKHGIKIQYIYDGNVHNYLPDFLIETKKGDKILEEVKGWVSNKHNFELKNKSAIEFCNKNNIKFQVNFYQRKQVIEY